MFKKLLLVIVGLVASIGMAIAAVNINTATEQELDSLPGVGPAKAKAIVEYRKANGNFKSVDDIKNVKGIGDKTFDDLKSQVAISGATTVAAPAKAADKMTYDFFEHAVEIPGGKVLPPGEYAFKMLDESAPIKVVQLLLALPT